MKIDLVESPSSDDLKFISNGLQSYNLKYLSRDIALESDCRVAAFVRNKSGKIIGGIKALAFWNYCMIEQLWLSDEARGNGFGQQLVQAVESYSVEKGFGYIRAETVDFQAKPFYEKLGYKVYAQLDDCPIGHTTFCLIKKLIN